MKKLETQEKFFSLNAFIQSNGLEEVTTKVIKEMLDDKYKHEISLDTLSDFTCGEVDSDDVIIEAIIKELGDNYVLEEDGEYFVLFEKTEYHRCGENSKELISILTCALADLEGVMPEFEPSGDREHSGWKTIEDIKKMLIKTKNQ